MTNRDSGITMQDIGATNQDSNQEVKRTEEEARKEAELSNLKEHLLNLIKKIEDGLAPQDNTLVLLSSSINSITLQDLEAWNDYSTKYKKIIKEIAMVKDDDEDDNNEQTEIEDFNIDESDETKPFGGEDSSPGPNQVSGFEKSGMHQIFKAWIRNRFSAIRGIVAEYNIILQDGDQSEQKQWVALILNDVERYLLRKDLEEIKEELFLLRAFSNMKRKSK